MKHFIQIGIHLNEGLAIETLTIDHNTTQLPSDYELIKLVCIGLFEVY